MLCIRCGGLTVLDEWEDLFEVRGSVSIEIWRCICCGAREYPLRLKNSNFENAAAVRHMMVARMTCRDRQSSKTYSTEGETVVYL